MREQIHYICEGCGHNELDKSVLAVHEKDCLKIIANQKALEARQQKAADEFSNSIKQAHEIAPKTVEFLKKYNGYDFEIKETGLRFNPVVSNTHSAPHGKLTNWYQKSELPKGYPGWMAWWQVRMTQELHTETGFTGLFKNYDFYCFSNVKDKYYIPNVYFGDGGGGFVDGMYEMNYSVIFWAEDFLYLKKEATKILLKEQYDDSN
jgi:hypothetical protein